MGWIAEEAFGTALFCFLLSPNDVKAVLKRAVVTGGDSDSIACIAGALVGAYCGIEAFPHKWVESIEYPEELKKMADFYSN
jgi:ADP-ribosylglycohydrolase